MAELDPALLDAKEDHLEDLEEAWARAVKLRAGGDEAAAAAALEAILKTEPRLAEPRLELAHIHLLHERYEDAREHTRLAVSTLRAGGQWTQDVPSDALLSFALNLHGETYAQELENGDLFLVDRARFTEMWNTASEIFAEACAVDGSNVDAQRNRTRFARLAVESEA